MNFFNTVKKALGFKPVYVGELNNRVTPDFERSKPNFTIVNIRQGTKEWHNWRNQGIGASDAPAIMGEIPWKGKIKKIIEEKCFGTTSDYSNKRMEQGREYEREARWRFEKKFDVKIQPACLQSIIYEWLHASVDGLAADRRLVLEIKCGESVYRHVSNTQQVPKYYSAQLQHILAVTGFASIDFWCYWPEYPELHLQIKRDNEYIDRLIETERVFWKSVLKQRDYLRER